MTVESIMVLVDAETAPHRMSKESALDFLERLKDELESRMDALRDEIE
jgi:hypothetical protein